MRYAADKTFDAETADAMREAFKAAWASLMASGPIEKDGVEAFRETLAMRIIDNAQAGERDVTRLRDDALAYLASLKVQKQA